MPNPWDRQPRQTTWLPEDTTLACPHCGQPTDSLKQYRFISWVVFYVIDAAYQLTYYRACPVCMRKLIARRAVWNLIPANLLWFVLVMPWGLGLIAATFRKGHSQDVLRNISLDQAIAREAQRQ